MVQLEALLFGQAGFLEEKTEDVYPKNIRQEYQFLRHKYGLTPLSNSIWKFMRMRPVNFPTIRISQFANLIHRSGGLFSEMIADREPNELKQLFKIGVSEYWQEHYLFGKSSGRREKRMGEGSIDNILINTVGPFLFLYGKQKGEDKYIQRSLELFRYLVPEDNSIVKKFRLLEVKPEKAGQTQAIIQLNNSYCAAKKCLNCAIGFKILSAQSIDPTRS
jgi:hypothetical protein